MSAEEVVNAFISAIEKGDIDGCLALMSADAEYDNVPMSKVIGHEAIRGTLAMFLAPDQKTHFEVLRQAATGNVVMNERVDHLEVFGKHVDIAVAGVFEVHDGKITLWRDYFDLAAFNSQIA